MSPTSINAFLRCPRKFYYSKIAKLKQRPSIYLIRGIAVHTAIENFYRMGLNKCANTDYDELKKILFMLFKTAWDNQENQLKRLRLKKDELDFFYEDSKKMILNFLDDFIRRKNYSRPPPVIEKTLFSKKHLLLARLDKIERDVNPPLITDFKTSKSIELSPDYKRQMGICALLYEEQYGVRPHLALHFLKFKDGVKKFQFSDDGIAVVKNIVADVHRRTRSEKIEDYPCTCGWCKKEFYAARPK